MLTKKFKELTIEIGTLKKELKNSEAKNNELTTENNNLQKSLEEANKIAKESQMKLKSKEALIKQIQKRMNTMTTKPGENKTENHNEINNEEIKKLKDEINNKDELVAQLSKEKEEMEEKIKNYLNNNKDELITKINRKDEVIAIQKNKIEELEKKINIGDNKNNDVNNGDNLEEELKNKKNKLNKLETKITIAKVNFNKILKEIKINDENKLFIVQLMKNLGFDDKDIKQIEDKSKEIKESENSTK